MLIAIVVIIIVETAVVTKALITVSAYGNHLTKVLGIAPPFSPLRKQGSGLTRSAN